MNRSLTLAASLLALAACGGGGKDTPPPPPPPPVTIATFQPGGTLLGQPAWDSAPPATNTCTASSLFFPYGGVGWDGTLLLAADSSNGRLLGYSPLPGPETQAASTPDATFVIGEPNATTCDLTGTLWIPQAPAIAGTRLVVADAGLQQVLVWDGIPAAWDAAPSVTVGDGNGACSGTSLFDPRGAIVVGTRLLVADAGNNRVLVYDLADTSAPRLVLGQQESASADPFDRCAFNDVDADGIDGTSGDGASPDAATMRFPTAVWSDGTRVIVADTDNHRLLVWNTFPTSSGEGADVVIGQASMTASAAGSGAAGLDSPQSIASDGEQLFVADTWNNRVLVYPSIPTTSGASATIVVGQGDFDHVAPNDDDQDGGDDGVPSARTLSAPSGVAVIDEMLAVTDTANGRIVIYRPPVGP